MAQYKNRFRPQDECEQLKRKCIDDQGGDKLPLEPGKTIRIEKVPETSEGEAWANFNKRLNDLANQGYRIMHATDTYILLRRTRSATRREE